MKKILFSVIAIAITFFAVTSCDDDEFTENDALNNDMELISFKDSLMKDSLLFIRDSLKQFGVIEYSVKVFNASENSTLKSANDAGTEGIKVFIAQNGYVDTAVTDASGMVIFEDMRIGVANVSVQSSAYTDVAFLADITPENLNLTNATEFANVSLYHVATQIAVFDLTNRTATLEGKVTIETNLLNGQPEIANGVTVIASIDVEATSFEKYYMELDAGTEYTGDIIEISYSAPSLAFATVDGLYTIDVPATPDGIEYKLTVDDFVADQSLLMNERYGKKVYGAQDSVRTIFGENASVSKIPTVAPAYVTIGDPTGNVNLQPTTDAEAFAIVTASGVEAIHIVTTGSGYTQEPNVVITSATGEGATATATLLNGRVSDVVMTANGIGYGAGTTVAFEEAVEHAELEAVVEFGITDITMGNKGTGYTAAPAVTIYGDGTGATAQAVMTGIVDDFTVSNVGSAYTQVPDVLLTGGGGANATATAVLNDFGPVLGVDVNTTLWYDGSLTLDVEFDSPYGTGATGTVDLDNNAGRILALALPTAGVGYTQIPTLSIEGNALIRVTSVGGGAITGYTIDDAGSGYSSIPTITVVPATGDVITTPASFTATVEYPLVDVVVNSNGTTYEHGNTSLLINAANVTGSVTPVISRSVESLTITNAGTGYTTAPTVQIITKDGDTGTGATATSALTQIVDEIVVLTPGQGYANGNTLVSIDAPAAGTQATASITGYEGTLASVNILDGGSGYTAEPNITLTGGGAGVDFVPAEISLTITAGAVSAVTVDNPGVEYTSAPAISLLTYVGAATAEATTNPAAGQIEQINISEIGEGYIVAPIVEIEDIIGVTTKAVATATISNGGVVNIEVTNSGAGYYKAPVIKLVVPNYASAAQYSVDVNDQGVVTGFTKVDAGMGYDAVPSVVVVPALAGVGSGATGLPTVVAGQVTEIKLTNGGSGYLGQNTPGYLGTVANISSDPTINGEGFAIFNDQDYYFVSDKKYILDIYLGTGERVDE